jgi:hypothetical protein
MVRKLCLLIPILFVAIFLIYAHASNALDFSGEVPFTTITFAGLTSPNSFIEINLNGATIGTTSSDIAGNFSYKVGNYGSSGETTFVVTAIDIDNNPTSSIPVTIDVGARQDNTISNIDLSPSARFISDVYSGYANPKSTINIFLDKKVYTSTTSNTDGFWQYKFDKASFAVTRYTLTSDWVKHNVISAMSPPIIVVFFDLPHIALLPAASSKVSESLFERVQEYIGMNADIIELFAFSGGLLYFSSPSVKKRKNTNNDGTESFSSVLTGILGIVFLVLGFAANLILFSQDRNVVAALLVLAYPSAFFLGRHFRLTNS